MRVQLAEVKEELVDIEAEKAIASPMPKEIKPSSNVGVAEGDDTKIKKSGEAIDKAKKKPAQVKPGKATETEEAIAAPMPEKMKCGKDSRCESPHIIKHGKPEGIQRWRCKKCGGTF